VFILFMYVFLAKRKRQYNIVKKNVQIVAYTTTVHISVFVVFHVTRKTGFAKYCKTAFLVLFILTTMPIFRVITTEIPYVYFITVNTFIIIIIIVHNSVTAIIRQ